MNVISTIKGLFPISTILRHCWWNEGMKKIMAKGLDYVSAAKKIFQHILDYRNNENKRLAAYNFIDWVILNSTIPTQPWLSEQCDKFQNIIGAWSYVELKEKMKNPVNEETLQKMAKEEYDKKCYLTSAFLYAKAGCITKAEKVLDLHNGWGFQPPIWKVKNMILKLEAKKVVK